MAKVYYTQEIATALRAGLYQNLSSILPDPDPILAKIGHRSEIYQQILSDPKVCACVEQRKAGCMALLWDVQGDRTNAKAVEYIKQALHGLGMSTLISDILDAVLWGFQPLEIMWEMRGGLFWPAKVISKPAHWFRFTVNNELRFLSQGHPEGEELKPRKFLLAQHNNTYTNPYGEKLLPKCFWPVTFKKGAWKWWVTATEKFGSPFIVGKVPRGTDSSEIDKLNESLQALVQDVTAVLPNDTAVEIMDGQSGRSAASSTSPHHELIEQCNAEIALAILGQTLTTEVGSTGSYAAAKTHNDVRADITAGDKRMVEKTLQQLIDWMCELNWSGSKPPIISMWHEEDVDKDLAERDKILSETGIRFSKSYYLRAYGLQDDDFELADQRGAEFAEPELKPRLSKVKRQFNADDYQLDGAKLSEFGKAIVGPIIKLINEGRSYEEVREKLENAYPQLPTDDLEEALARCFYVAAIEGNLNG